MSAGLDLSRPPSLGPGSASVGGGAGEDLEDDIARARAQRASRLGQTGRTLSSDSSSSPSFDPRDTASTRENITNLVAAGQRSLGSSGANGNGSTPSLAMFMGGGGQRRVHRVNQGMTEDEKEETERLEKEMAATRARWGNKGADEPQQPAGGMSLAALMMGGKKATTPPTTQPAANSSTPAAADFASPPAQSREEPPASPPLVEAKIVSRSPPAEATPAFSSSASTAPALSSSSPEITTSPRLTGGDTLTRLRSSSIVADRLKWSQEKQQDASAPAPASPVKTDKADKRRSVLDRWGRDAPNVSDSDALKSPPASSAAWSRSPPAADAEFEGVSRGEAERRKEEQLDKPAEPAQIGVAQVEEVEIPEEPVAAGVEPRLVHVTAGRARPPKSTPRTLSSATPTSDSAAATPSPAPVPSTQEPEEKKGYSKPAWSGAPIGVKEYTKPSPSSSVDDYRPTEDRTPEVKHVRGVALPGLSSGGSLRPTPARSPSIPSPAAPAVSPAPLASAVEVPSSPRPSVRAAAMRWGQADAAASAEKEEKLREIKASYGVRQDSAAAAPTSPVKARAYEPLPPREQPKPAFSPAPVQARQPSPPPPALSKPTPAPTAAAPKPAPASRPAPAATPSFASSTIDQKLLSLVSSPPKFDHLPPGETLGLDVFHLNSPSDDPHPIEHNFLLFRSEILGVVHRSAASGAGDEVETRVWVWRGDEAQETPRMEERVRRLTEKTGVEPVEVRYGSESPALVEAFSGQVTVLKGLRDEFDHLAKRLYTVRSYEGAVFVEEVDLAVRNLCSGYCAAFSSDAGEVFAWLGEGATDGERQACCEFAESIADGRSVNVLAEGEETAWFWHSLDDGLEYASAYYWRYRPLHPDSPVSVLRIESTTSPGYTLVPSLELSPSHVSVIDGGYAEHWVVVPEQAKGKKDDIRKALEVAKRLSSAWEERGFASRTPYHVIAFPSLVPRDVPFLSRQLDFSPLNAGARPTRMHVFTADEAEEVLL
ncbi:hypothetical protein JCM10207_009023 [Rhodosporidiobolus poonsookiae]